MIQIIAIRKDSGNHSNPHEAISEFKWLDPKSNEVHVNTRRAVVAYLEEGGSAYVETNGYRAYCGVRNNGHIKYVQTYSDGYYNNNLLSLPEF